MIELNIEKFETLISNLKNTLIQIDDEREKINSNAIDLGESYYGKDLEYLFVGPTSKIQDFKKISEYLENIINLLERVKKSYIAQQDSTVRSLGNFN